MKRILSAAVLVVLLLVMSFSIVQIETNDVSHADDVGDSNTENDFLDDVSWTIASVYGIPDSVLETMPKDIYSALAADIDTVIGVSTSEAYFEIIYEGNGESTIREASYQEYMDFEKKSGTHTSDWIKIHTAIVDMDSTAQVSAAYTWLTRAASRMTDVIGLSISNGIFVDNSADGFYVCANADDFIYTDFSETPDAFDYSGRSFFRKVALEKEKNFGAGDFLFIRGSIYKEGASESLLGLYAHQKAKAYPDFTLGLDSSGMFYSDDIDINKNYDQLQGCISIIW